MNYYKDRITTPNFEETIISVEFLVLHYSACSRARIKETFENPAKEVSVHLVIDEDGTIDEVVACLDGAAYKAWHAGRSEYEREHYKRTEFNEFSIGIELINRNGNIFEYTEQQYLSLVGVIKNLQQIYPILRSPERIVGHEHIAGYRGKVDPGVLFDRGRIQKECFSDTDEVSILKSRVPESFTATFDRFKEVKNADDTMRHAVSYAMEQVMKQIMQS